MGLVDRVKAQAGVGLAKASEAGKAGQAKLDAVAAKRKAEGLLRDLGAAVYAERAGRQPPPADDVDALVAGLQQYEAEHGPITS